MDVWQRGARLRAVFGDLIEEEIMSGFRKAKAEQAALKVGFYGPPGAGKTFTALLCAEGLAKMSGKRIAYVDTERGTDFYCQAVKHRKIHPEAFDFDAIYTRSITEVSDSIRALNADEHGVVVIDSITHIWEAARAAYAGRETKIGTIPFHAWAKIKKPYKELIAFLLSSPMHVFFCGRQGNEFEEDEESGEMKKVGVKMKAEGETAYEPHILIRMEAVRDTKSSEAIITAFAEKDRTGILSGRTIESPSFETIVKPLIGLLGGKQAQIATESETSVKDAEALEQKELEREANSKMTLEELSARITLAQSAEELKGIGKAITPDLKKTMLAAHVTELREKYLEAEKKLGKPKESA